MLPAGFSAPVAVYPSDYCSNEAKFNDLVNEIGRAADELSFEAWLAGMISMNCAEAG